MALLGHNPFVYETFQKTNGTPIQTPLPPNIKSSSTPQYPQIPSQSPFNRTCPFPAHSTYREDPTEAATLLFSISVFTILIFTRCTPCFDLTRPQFHQKRHPYRITRLNGPFIAPTYHPGRLYSWPATSPFFSPIGSILLDSPGDRLLSPSVVATI